jgi:eukaryotic-like serine/threonine-protein kinase
VKAIFIGPYEVLQRLNEGGTGEVYIASHPDRDDLVALKIAKPELLESSEAVAAFRNGLRIQMSLGGHPNIVSTYNIGTHDDGRPYFSMELLELGTLAEAENRKLFVTRRDVLELMIKITRAVQFSHERGVLHCDLKPSNLLLRSKLEPLVSDFGLARAVDESTIKHGTTFRGG